MRICTVISYVPRKNQEEKYNMTKQRIFFSLILTAVFVYFLAKPTVNSLYITGKTMGTTYSVSVWGKASIKQSELKKQIDFKLKEINAIASTWIQTSEISKFNLSTSVDNQNVSLFLANMVSQSKAIHDKSQGVFDITVAPLIDLWGFDKNGRITKAPSKSSLKKVLSHIGADKIHVDIPNSTIKKDAQYITINLSAIAKGGGVDAVAMLLEEQGFKNYLIEIGGEVRALGTKQDNTLWLVGIETPNPMSGVINSVVALKNTALATSGDYRNYFEENGVRYSHIIDPTTGKPISHKLASASVLANTASLADGWATAIMVLGEKKGMEIATKNNIAVFMLVHDGNTFKSIYSPKWVKETEK